MYNKSEGFPSDLFVFAAAGGNMKITLAMRGTMKKKYGAETLKVLLGREETLAGKLLAIDMLNHEYETVEI